MKVSFHKKTNINIVHALYSHTMEYRWIVDENPKSGTEDSFSDTEQRHPSSNTLIVLQTASVTEPVNYTSLYSIFRQKRFNIVILNPESSISHLELVITRAVKDAKEMKGGGVICMVFCGHGNFKGARDGERHGTMILEPHEQEQSITQKHLIKFLDGFSGMFFLVLGACFAGHYDTWTASHESTFCKPYKHTTLSQTPSCKYIVMTPCNTDEETNVIHVGHMLDAFASLVRKKALYKNLNSEIKTVWNEMRLSVSLPYVTGDTLVHGVLMDPPSDMVRTRFNLN